jgi:hypothetical protein
VFPVTSQRTILSVTVAINIGPMIENYVQTKQVIVKSLTEMCQNVLVIILFCIYVTNFVVFGGTR